VTKIETPWEAEVKVINEYSEEVDIKPVLKQILKIFFFYQIINYTLYVIICQIKIIDVEML